MVEGEGRAEREENGAEREGVGELVDPPPPPPLLPLQEALREGVEVIEEPPLGVGGAGEGEGRVVGERLGVTSEETLGVELGARGERLGKEVTLPSPKLNGVGVVEKVGGCGVPVTPELCVPPIIIGVMDEDKERKGDGEEVGVVRGVPLAKALGPPEGTPTVDDGESVEDGEGRFVPLPPP